MGIMLSLRKQWSDKILDGSKPIEFRSSLPKNLKENETFYLYETSKQKGCKMVVGECQLDYIIPVTNEEGKWPMLGAYPFIDYYFEFIKGDKETADHYRALKKEFDTYKQYRYGFILNYAFSEYELKSLREKGTLVDTWKIFDMKVVRKILDDNDISGKKVEECDKWLMSIGFYNDMDESYYKYGLVLKNVKRYDSPKPLSEFKNPNMNTVIQNAPQSWCYAEYIGGE